MKPSVSVCLPTYNGSKYLRECLDSVLAQTFTDFEILIVDDQSSDNTVEIAKDYAQNHAQIKLVVNEKNLGLVGNWNRCVELAQGEWIKFVFQDDLIAPNCLEKMLSVVKSETKFISCKRDFIFDIDIPQNQRNNYLNLPSLDKLFSEQILISPQEYRQTVLNHINRIYINFVGEPTTVMIHRSLFKRFGLFNPNLIQICDLEFWHRIGIHTGITFLPETLATFRIHKNSTTNINQESRNYRTNTLELLIILHDFVYNPIYQPLRDMVHNCQPTISLTKLLTDKAYDAKRIAQKSRDEQIKKEWEDFLELYPRFSELSQRSFLKRIIYHGKYQWKKLQQRFKV